MADRGNELPRGRVRRTMPLAGFTARAAGGAMVAALREKAGDQGAVARFHEKTADRYSELLGHSKGVLMKAGQLMSMMELGPPGEGEASPYQAALSRLQADAPPMDAALARSVLERDLGCSTEQIFAEFTAEPMAAASIGQVHRAVLHDGRQVAVKIQYPSAAEAIRHDLANTELLATVLRFVTSASGNAIQADLRQASREVAARISEEVDYRHEAQNITKFARLYDGHPFIRIPDVVAEASADRVLTMTYIDGVNWSAALEADQDLKNTWAEAITRFSTGSFRHANLFHADPHPGNYRFRPDGTIGIVDFGCVKVIPETLRLDFVKMIRAAMEERKDDVRDLLDQMGFFQGDSTPTADEIYTYFAGPLVEQLTGTQPMTFTADAPQTAMRAFMDVRSREHPVRRMSIPDDLVFLTRVNLSMTAVLGKLGATLHNRAILDDMDGTAEPLTPLGEAHIAWVRDRGLPFGLQVHEHH
ncbi:AarF/ABC1/UbiB kinase family protein [Mycolicibacterium farcinogenes]|uniref:ABC1 kinase family protein n=1 Tax=Mycolicibacterium farcinogenes TaxID=1802 RepID=UPI001C8D89B7|nr:AarF/ABC1/UbiB kinase family protein [Mycolicibacterium farcinogenes]QZH59723.1 AarF/ABC1/UbiB kinase family protein [Mycolicibacterium farcinogenes]